MDFDDSFTERVAQKSRARKEFLNLKKGEIPSVGKKRSVLTDEHQVNADEPPSKSPKRSSALTFQGSSGKENLEIEENNTFVPIRTASNNRGLAALRKNGSNDEDDKPSHEHLPSEPKTYVFSTNTKELCSGRSSRMASLAANIRQWEDEVGTPSIPTKSFAPSANVTSTASQNTFSMKLIYTEKQSNSKEVSNSSLASASVHTENKMPASIHKKIDFVDTKSSPKKLLDWNAAVAATLETSLPVAPNLKTEDMKNDGFPPKCHAPNAESRGSDESMDENDFAENYNIMSNLRGDLEKEMDYSPFKHVRENQKKIEAMEDQKKTEPPKMQVREIQKKMEEPKIETSKRTAEVDPAELPLAARRALFEKNLLSGTPKVNEDVCFSLSIAQRAAMFENAAKMNCNPKSKGPVVLKCDKINVTHPVQPVVKANAGIVKAVSPVKKISPPHTSAPSPTKRVGNHVFLVQQKLAGKAANDSQDEESEDNEEISSMDQAEDCESDQEPENFISEKTVSLVKKISPPRTSAPSPTKQVGNHVFLVQQKLAGKAANDSQDEESEDNEEISSMDQAEDWESDQESENCNFEERMEGYRSENDHSEELSSSAVEDYPKESHFKFPPGKTMLKNNSEVSDSQKLSSSSMQNNSEADSLEKSSSISGENEVRPLKKSSSSSMTDSNSVFDDSKKLPMSSVENNSFRDSSYGRQSCTSDSSVGSYSATSADGKRGLENTKETPLLNTVGRESYTSDSSVESYSATSVDGESGLENKKETPLLYTVSFYRKQKQETRLTPVQKIVRREKEQSSNPESPDAKYTEIIQERIKGLQEEILRQQTIISQTSQALNLCSATLEFSGSTEQVEGERLLLVATQKRQACLNEITRLKTFGAQGESIADDRGTMTISDIILPLKREFVSSQVQGKDDDTVHYFLCLIRHGAQVIVTQMISTDERTSDGTLVFTNHIQLQDLPPTFSVIFEVYALQTKKEVLPHEKKYHIKRESSKIRLTPKGKKNNEKMMFPTVSSPGGPNAVRSPCFGVVGFTRFTLQNRNKTVFTLDKVPFTSPLEGILRVNLQLHAEHKVMEKGFLTLFDDVGGYGAWLRRWCVLDANNLAMWKYPDDEHKKKPAAIINLKHCVTGLVKPVARNICARPHTFQLVTMRPEEEGDQPTLVSRKVNTFTSTKHLLSADTKEERIVWCDKLNEALNNVRKWDPQALRPVESIQV